MTPHQPVLLGPVIQILAPHQGECYLDGTAGYGGHAAAIADSIGPDGRLILIDRDITAVKALAERFDDRAQVVHASFVEGAQRLLADATLADMILLDLGVSSPQLDNVSRGFSFKADAPLDMRMDQTDERTAADIVNRLSESKLAWIIRTYGEEPNARAVARGIIAARPLKTTAELAAIVRKHAAPTKGIDSATRTFQGLRIEVNDELGQLSTVLPLLVDLLAPGGRLAVISFHSLEDRIVKQFFHTESRDYLPAQATNLYLWAYCERPALNQRSCHGRRERTYFQPASQERKTPGRRKAKPKQKESECLSRYSRKVVPEPSRSKFASRRNEYSVGSSKN